MAIAQDYLIKLQNRPQNIRNICILAHVDHGKTSLSDNLLASNGIISQSLQGQIRYLDSRPDEQERGITMESSAISLYFRVLRKIEEKDEVKEYLINLIDSPGHIDFSSEVSTASRLCDGAVVVVDVVEGVCSQTVTVLRQAWMEKMTPILVLNKIDRLISELQMTPMDAFNHLIRLVEQVNAVMGTFFQGQRMEEDLKWREKMESSSANKEDFVETSDDDLYFAPEKNNVVFGSAIDGWGFNISQFAAIYERKLGMNRKKLEKVLWGEYYLDPKTKSVIAGASKLKGRNLKPLFVQLVLDNIWAVYNSCIGERKDTEKLEKIVNALGLKVQPRDIKTKDGKSLLHQILGQWIPLSRAILLSVVDILPSPLEAQRQRIPMIVEATPSYSSIKHEVVDAMTACDRTGPVTAYVSKVVSVFDSEIPKEKRDPAADRVAEIRARSERVRAKASGEELDSLSEYLAKSEISGDDEQKLIGFARVYSGTLRVGDTVQVLNPKFDPAQPSVSGTQHEAKITGLFLLMGRELVLIDAAPAGSIVGIGGLDDKIMKSGTIVSTKFSGPNLASTNAAAVVPILRVAVEPVDPTKIPQVEEGLRLLNMSDPCVQVYVQENGEQILATAGELHLERCLKDLKERYAKVDIHCSPPIVPYRETIVKDGEFVSEDGLKRGEVKLSVGNLDITLQVYPLGEEVTSYISQNADRIRGLDAKKCDEYHEEHAEQDEELLVTGIEKDSAKLDDLRVNLDKILIQHKSKDIVSFGPKHVGPNILFDETETIARRAFPDADIRSTRSHFEESILTGFQMAMAKGNICGEPLEGVGCVVTAVVESEAGEQSARIYSLIRDSIHKGIQQWSPRIKLAQYLCDIQAPAEVLGKVYSVITKRRGRVLSEEMREGTPFFTVHASVPVAEAFGFSAEMRKRTSGAANPQLVFAGFEILDQDPYWVPTTEEELEDLGELADKENIAMSYVKQIRRRKGMSVDEKLVERSDRQRTMKR